MPAPSIPENAIEALVSAEGVAALTGAGVSAESGVPTFRGKGGLWRTFKPEQLATPEAFEADPRTVWDWYLFRRGLMAKSEPNPGHYALALWEKHFGRFSLITQNVDGLHHRAGSQVIYELHGNICRTRCHVCGTEAGSREPEPKGDIPRCHCGGLLRPDVVWFGEPLPERMIRAAWNDVREADVFLSVGTSSVVYPAAGLIEVARAAEVFMIEVNPEPTELSELFDVCLRESSGITLPGISQRLGLNPAGGGFA